MNYFITLLFLIKAILNFIIKFLLDMETYFKSGIVNAEMKTIMIQVDSLTLEENKKYALACVFVK